MTWRAFQYFWLLFCCIRFLACRPYELFGVFVSLQLPESCTPSSTWMPSSHQEQSVFCLEQVVQYFWLVMCCMQLLKLACSSRKQDGLTLKMCRTQNTSKLLGSFLFYDTDILLMWLPVEITAPSGISERSQRATDLYLIRGFFRVEFLTV